MVAVRPEASSVVEEKRFFFFLSSTTHARPYGWDVASLKVFVRRSGEMAHGDDGGARNRHSKPDRGGSMIRLLSYVRKAWVCWFLYIRDGFLSLLFSTNIFWGSSTDTFETIIQRFLTNTPRNINITTAFTFKSQFGLGKRLQPPTRP